MSKSISLIDFWKIRRKQKGWQTVVKPCHEFKAKTLTDLVLGKLPTPNLMILEPPRIGKTDLGSKTFIPWAASYFPDSEFIIGGYNLDLPVETIADIRSTYSSAWYRSMVGSDWGVKLEMRGDKTAGRQDWFKTDLGGVYKAVGRGGGATGFGAGKLREEFGGHIHCFPYDEYVWTEKGKLKIGHIVENKLNIKILSKNIFKNIHEYMPINDWYKNPGNSIVEVVLSNGYKFKCTPCHRIYTKNRGYVKAINLTSLDILDRVSSNSFYYSSIYSKFTIYASQRFRCITNNFNLIWRKFKLFLFPWVNLPRLSSHRFPCLAFFNLINNSSANAIFFRENLGAFRASSYFYGFRSRQFSSGSFFKNRECTMPFGIGDIFRSCTIAEIFKPIVLRIAIYMSDFIAFFSGSKKGYGHSSMKIHRKKFTIYTALKNWISTPPIFRFIFKNFFFELITRLVFSLYNSCVAFCSSIIRNTIAWVSGDVSPLFISKIGHVPSTYCLNIRSNHNMYIGESQGILVSNCDDPLKAQEASSNAAMKEANTWISETLQSRRNRLQDPKTPIVLIMQRLHPNDPAGYLLKTERHRWTVVQIPAHNDQWESIWPERISIDELKHMKDYAPDLYYSQYMQEPSDEGYIVFRPEWWNLWDDIKEVEKRITLKFITADTAFKEKDSADWSVFQCWGAQGSNGLYLLDQVRGRWEFPELIKQARDFKNKHTKKIVGVTPATEMWIEDKASGISLAQTLQREGIGARAWTPPDFVDPDKVARANQSTMSISSGRVFIPDPEMPDYGWVDIFAGEHTAFTKDDSHAYDDQVDAQTMANLIWQSRGGGVGPLPTWNNIRKLKNVKQQTYTLQ